MGIAFSLIGAFDGYRMDDSYPGYGRLFAICQQALDDFRDAKEEESNLLAELKDHIFDRLDRHTGDIESRRAAHHGVLQQRDGFRELFLRHLDHLEQAGNELLTCYRTANTNARNAPPPAHFSQRWIMAETEGQILASEDQSFAPFPDNEAARVLSQLEATRRDILRSYAEAQSHYTSVAEVVRGIPDHITAPSPEPAGSS